MRKALLVISLLAAFGLGLLIRGGGAPDVNDPLTSDSTAPTTWTCSMHPQFQLPEAGQCPICFMDLIPLEDDSADDLGPRTLVLSEAGAALAEIRTSPVERRAVEVRTRLTGKIDYDETRLRTITSRVAGRLDTLFVDYTGTRVATGDRLASLYSPALYAGQVELLNALEAEQSLRESTDPRMRRTATATVSSARERLRLWGLSSAQVEAIERGGSARSHLTIESPLDGIVVHKTAVEGSYVEIGTRLYTVADLTKVWVSLDAHESDLAWLAEGQTVGFTVAALPGRDFEGTVIFMDPMLDPDTRTVKVRLDVDNADGSLRPGLFVNAVVDAETLGTDGDPLVIPATAPLITGERAVVYVRLPDHEKPTFEGREITLGPRAGDHYVVSDGLEKGEIVVTRGNFKIDSALQIQAKPSMMNPEGGGPMPGHDHGSPTPAAPDESDSAEHQETFAVDDAFKKSLVPIMDAYLALQSALVGDDDGAAAKAAGKAGQAVDAVSMPADDDAHMAWMADAKRLRDSFAVITGAADIAARRHELQKLTDTVWVILHRYGYQDDRVVRLFHCPMAYRGKGGDWLQLETVTANPYFGASMLRCGSQTDTLTVISAAGAR
jgi:membrane fusion protein, copper/silver efflux system